MKALTKTATACMLSMLCSVAFFNAHAVNSVYECTATSQQETSIQPRADTIVKKFRTNNGKLQYRRWNETRSCWVDSAWMDA